MKYSLILFLFIFSFASTAQDFQFQKAETNVQSSFRGMSVVDNQVAWVGGSQGYVGRTTNGGTTWEFQQVKDFEKSEFRSVYAFDANRAIIANVGSPAHILLTTDGGKNWKSVYSNTHADAFFDGIDFWNEREGIIYGDPIDGKMLLLKTTDGGLNWNEVTTAPTLEKGEASFAASGTGVRCINKKELMICTGGVVSRLWFSNDQGNHWTTIKTPILQGESATGIFSAVKNKNTMMIVGGDYQKETQTINHHFYSVDGGVNWIAPATPSRGYRECVEFISGKTYITTGPTGTELTTDNGVTWKPISYEKGLHVIRKARKGSLLLAAGGKGQIFVIRKK